MKRYTQAEFDALPIVNGVRDCPTGDYTELRVFGNGCDFGNWCIFGSGCDFGQGSWE